LHNAFRTYWHFARANAHMILCGRACTLAKGQRARAHLPERQELDNAAGAGCALVLSIRSACIQTFWLRWASGDGIRNTVCLIVMARKERRGNWRVQRWCSSQLATAKTTIHTLCSPVNLCRQAPAVQRRYWEVKWRSHFGPSS
jgi:hypothetical protein